MIPSNLLDKKIKIDPSLYKKICIPTRLIISLFLLLSKPSPQLYFILFFMSLFIVIGFTIKYINNPPTWKNYLRPIIIYGIISTITLFQLWSTFKSNEKLDQVYMKIIGLLVLFDLLLGEQSNYVASTYLRT